MTGESKESTQFVLKYDGMLRVVTLAEWAKLWEHDYYAGDEPPSTVLLTWDGADTTQHHLVTVTRTRTDDSDFIHYLITVSHCDDTCWVRIDGRA